MVACKLAFVIVVETLAIVRFILYMWVVAADGIKDFPASSLGFALAPGLCRGRARYGNPISCLVLGYCSALTSVPYCGRKDPRANSKSPLGEIRATTTKYTS